MIAPLAICSDFDNDAPSTAAVTEQLRRIAEAGFTHVHWGHDWEGNYVYAKSEMDQIRTWLDELGLGAKGVHASEGSVVRYQTRLLRDDRKDLCSVDEDNRQAGVELLQNRIELAHRLDTDEVVLHVRPHQEMDASAPFWTQLYKSLDQAVSFAASRGVRIALENLLTPLEQQDELLGRLFERYPFEQVGLCFDTGHAHIMSHSAELLERYLSRLCMVHLSDNNGPHPAQTLDEITAVRADAHAIPFEGIIDWEAAMLLVARSPYELPLVLEVCRRKAEDESFLERAFDVGQQLTALVGSFRQVPDVPNGA